MIVKEFKVTAEEFKKIESDELTSVYLQEEVNNGDFITFYKEGFKTVYDGMKVDSDGYEKLKTKKEKINVYSDYIYRVTHATNIVFNNMTVGKGITFKRLK